jgi:DNA-binding LytR/AlgR family response regulator
MKVLIIEDEAIAAQRLKDMLCGLDRSIEVVEVLDSVEASINFFRQPAPIDLVFMDIELGDGQSFEIFERATVEAPVIFTTAYQQYALKAFKQASIDYLLKPLCISELEAALLKYRWMVNYDAAQIQKAIVSAFSKPKGNAPKSRFLIKLGTRLVLVPADSVAYFYTKDKLFFIKTKTNEDLHFDKCLDDIEAEVDGQAFFRVNRQFILHYSAIESVYGWFGGKLKVQVNPAPHEEVIISRLRAAEFKRWLGE